MKSPPRLDMSFSSFPPIVQPLSLPVPSLHPALASLFLPTSLPASTKPLAQTHSDSSVVGYVERLHLRGTCTRNGQHFCLADEMQEIATERSLARALFPRTQLRNIWTPPRSSALDQEVVIRSNALPETGYISDIDFSPNGRTVAASSTGESVSVLDPNTGRKVHYVMRAHNSPVTRIRFLTDFQFATGSTDCTVALWDVRNLKEGAVNTWRAHCQPIRSIDYDSTTGQVITASQDGSVRYWHLSQMQTPKSSPPEGSSSESDPSNASHGVIFNCPKFKHASMNDDFLVLSNNRGVLFVIENLSVKHLKVDTDNIRFDDSIKMQLCFFNPNASITKRNKIRVIESEEYSPISWGVVSNMSCLVIHPTLPILLMRITTSRRMEERQAELKDWICICNLQRRDDHGGMLGSFGSDILEEVLLYAGEEGRYSTFVEKRPCFSICGRVIASPTSDGVRLMAFTPDLDSHDKSTFQPLTQQWRHAQQQPSFLSNSTVPTFSQIAKVEHLQCASICCKFSPNDLILAVGDANSQVYFCQPRL